MCKAEIQLIEAHCSRESLSIPLNDVSLTTELTLILLTRLCHILSTNLTNKIISTPARIVVDDRADDLSTGVAILISCQSSSDTFHRRRKSGYDGRTERAVGV